MGKLSKQVWTADDFKVEKLLLNYVLENKTQFMGGQVHGPNGIYYRNRRSFWTKASGEIPELFGISSSAISQRFRNMTKHYRVCIRLGRIGYRHFQILDSIFGEYIPPVNLDDYVQILDTLYGILDSVD